MSPWASGYGRRVSHPPVLDPATEPIAAGDSLENPCTRERGVLAAVHRPRGPDRFRLDGEESIAGSGEVVEIRRGHWHDWWNAGDEVAVARVWVSDGARFLRMIETNFGLARDPGG